MRRFVAIAWAVERPEAVREAAQLVENLKRSALWSIEQAWRGLRVFHNWPARGPMRVWRLTSDEGAGGVLFGRLFRRGAHDGSPLETLSPEEVSEICESAGQRLIDRYWGGFAAFLLNSAGDIVVLRDPSARVTVYRWRLPQVEVFFSDVADLLTLDIAALAWDWGFLANFLTRRVAHAGQTAFKKVTEVVAGEALTLRRGEVTSRMTWAPNAACAAEVSERIDEAAREVKEVTRNCVAAWAAVHEAIELHLSGGFDSAVVLGCLASLTARPRIACLNRYTLTGGEDERHYARTAAARAGVPLTEVAWSLDDVRFEDRLCEIPIAPQPAVSAAMPLDLAARNRLALDCEAQATWTGQGGDHLFWRGGDNLFVADHVLRHGLRDLPTILLAASRLTRRTVWSHLRLALRSRCRRHRWRAPDPVFGENFAARDVTTEDAGALHPWMEKSRVFAPGKRAQIAALVSLVHRHVPVSRRDLAPEAHPLISLPLIELCLALPTWLLLHQGQSRGLARMAFRSLLPASIQRRESKGSTTVFLVSAFRRQAAFLSPLLLEGHLARAGLLDRRKIEAVLRGRPLLQTELRPLLSCVAAEVWLQASEPLTRHGAA